MGSLQQGAYNAVKVCMGVKRGERVTIITDDSAMQIATALRTEAEKLKAKVSFFNLDDFENRRASKKNLLKKAPKEVLEAIEDSDITFYNAADKQFGSNTEVQARIKIWEHAIQYARHAHMPGVSVKMMETGMCVDYKKVHKITHKVYGEFLKDAKSMHIASRAGTDLAIMFGPTNKYPDARWRACGGLYHKKGESGNLPEGEVFTCPIRVNGDLVFDGCIGELSKDDLEETNQVISMKVVDSFCERDSINCRNKDLESAYRNYLSKHQNSYRVGEIGVGTNVLLRKYGFVGHMLQDEKYPGIHIAFGESSPDDTGISWEKEGGDPPTHIDGFIKHATLDVTDKDGTTKRLLKNGKFVFE
ncbi:MAG: aminopeptidase [archaeon]